MKRVTLIHNPQAGDEDHSRDLLVTLIRNAGYEVYYNSSKEDFSAALEDPGDLIAIAGGDGTVRKVALQILEDRAPIAILPMGTANNISKSLGFVGTPEKLIAGWKGARRKKFTVGSARSSWGKELFVEGIGIGLLSRAMSLLDAVDGEGDVDFSTKDDKVNRDLTALVVLLSEYGPMTLRVRVDGREISGQFLLLEVMNIKCVGSNLLLAPDADPSDDYLECAFLSESKRESFGTYLTRLVAGEQADAPVEVLRGKHIQIVWEGTEIHLDDKIWTKGTASSPPQTIDVELDGRYLEYLSPNKSE